MTDLDSLFEAHRSAVFGRCYRMLGEARSAEDATQETFLRAFQHLDSYDPQRSFRTWLLAIADHHCVDRLRRKQLAHLSTDDDSFWDHPASHDLSLQPEIAAIRQEDAAQVRQLLDYLRPQDRCAIVLRYWYGLSYVEIAAVMGATVNGVKSRLHRARTGLAERLALTMPAETGALPSGVYNRGASECNAKFPSRA